MQPRQGRDHEGPVGQAEAAADRGELRPVVYAWSAVGLVGVVAGLMVDPTQPSAFPTWGLARMPDYTLVEEELASYVRQGVMAGWTTVPATFTPGKKKLPDTKTASLLPVLG